MARKLTDKQALFAKHYAATLDATKSAELAGYAKANSGQLGYQLLQNNLIQNKIKDLRKNVEEKLHISIDMVIAEMWKLANVDPTQAFDERGNPVPISELPQDLRKAIKEIETYADFTEGVEVGQVRKYKFWDKTKALDMLAKHLGMYVERTMSLNVNVDEGDMDSEEFRTLKKRMIERVFEKEVKEIKPQVIEIEAD